MSTRGKEYTLERNKKISNTLKRLGIKPPSQLGKRRSFETKKKISDAVRGRISWIKGKHHSKQSNLKNRLAHLGRPSPIKKGVKRLEISGSKHWNWKGGITCETKKLRRSLEYRLWRKAVYERDGYKCVWCGSNKSGTLNADHIKPWADYPNLRFDINNGRTLCIKCHKKTDSYYLNRKRDELGRFIVYARISKDSL